MKPGRPNGWVEPAYQILWILDVAQNVRITVTDVKRGAHIFSDVSDNFGRQVGIQVVQVMSQSEAQSDAPSVLLSSAPTKRSSTKTLGIFWRKSGSGCSS